MKKIIKYFIILILGSKKRKFKILFGSNKGMNIYACPKTELSLILGTYELSTQNILRTLLKQGDTVLDIGANIGFTSLMMSKLIGKKGKLYSFEAIPSTTEILKKNIRLNKLENITVFNNAVSNKIGKSSFLIPEAGKNHTMASMVWHKKDHNTKKIEVNNIVIDDSKEFKNITPKFIKIDVEGAEGLVIQGMKKLLENNNIKLLIECSEIGRNDTWKILKKLNYKCFRKDNLKKEITSFNNYRNNDFLWIK